MKRIIVLLGVLAMTLGAMAQRNQHSNYIGLNLGGGMNTVLYPNSDGGKVGLGFMSELRYTHFFGTHFGVGFGLGYNLANSRYCYDRTATETGFTHPANGLNYDLLTDADNWMERQSFSLLTVPVEIFWREPLNDNWGLLFGLGAELELPLAASYNAYDGSVETQGYFPATNVTYSNLPAYGFYVYNANHRGTIDNVASLGLNVMADLGAEYALDDNWGLYLGIYCGYGLTNMKTSTSSDPLIALSAADPTQLDYNGVWASNEIAEAHLFNLGVKLGVNLGWDCHKGNSKGGDDQTDLVEYPDQMVVVEYYEDTTAVDTTAADTVVVEEVDEEARCNARRMNDPILKEAIENIDADINDAEQMADEAGNNEAMSKIADAKAKAADAKAAYEKGQYCRAYDLLAAAYADLADAYALIAHTYGDKLDTPEAKKAVADADLYAGIAHTNDLATAAAACRNARLNAELVRDADRVARTKKAQFSDPNFADALAKEALDMANDAKSKAAITDARDASGKAYRGDFAGCYAACALSFAESADAYANRPESAEDAYSDAADAKRFAIEASDAARMGDVAAAYRAARNAQEAAERARDRIKANQDENARRVTPDPETAPIDRASLERYLSDINGIVLFDFNRTEPRFDDRANLAIRALCRAMQADNRVKITITGHTDSIGSDESNMVLGKRRAEALKALMVSWGAPASCIDTESKGERQPVVDNDTDEHRQLNRRADITLK